MKRIVLVLFLFLKNGHINTADFGIEKLSLNNVWVNIVFPRQVVHKRICFSVFPYDEPIELNFTIQLPTKCNVSYLTQIVSAKAKNELKIKFEKYAIRFKRSGGDHFDPNADIEFSENNNVLYAYVYPIKK